MTAYLVVLFYLIALFFVEESVKNFKYKKIVFAIASFVPLVLLSSMKSVSVGSDTNTYSLAYEYLKGKSIGTVYRELDRSFCIVLSLFDYLNAPFNLVLLILYLFIYSPFVLFSFRYADNKSLFATFVYLFQMFVFLMSGLRQAIAISFCLFALFAFLNVRNKIFASILFICLVIIGREFHGSAFIFLLVLPFALLKDKIFLNALYFIPICFIFSLLSPYLYSLLFFLFESLFFYDPPKTSLFLDIGFSTYIIMGSCALFFAINKTVASKILNDTFGRIFRTDKSVFLFSLSNEQVIFYNISLVNVALLCIVSCSQVFVRIGYFFNPVFSILVASSFGFIKERRTRLILYPIILILLLFFFYFSVYRYNYLSIFPYKFFFQS